MSIESLINENDIFYSVPNDLLFVVETATITSEGSIFAVVDTGQDGLCFVNINPNHLMDGTLQLVGVV